MAAENKLADELMSFLASRNYKEFAQYLTDRDAVNLEHFKQTPMGKMYWIDLRRCFSHEGLNPNHILEIFGGYCGLDPVELRKRVIEIIEDDQKFWQHLGNVMLHMKFTTFDDWIADMKCHTCLCNELMLFILNKIHCRHTVVYMANHSSSTVHSPEPMDEAELHSIFDLHLMYLENYTFGELRRLHQSSQESYADCLCSLL